MRVLLEPGTSDSVETVHFSVKNGRMVRLTLYPEANLGADVAELQVPAPDGTFCDVVESGTAVELSAARNPESVFGPGNYRLNIPTRTAAWGVAISGE